MNTHPPAHRLYNAGKFPEFKGNFFFGCLRSARLIRVVLDGRKVVRQENLLEKKLGRIREVAEGPERIMRLVPAK